MIAKRIDGIAEAADAKLPEIGQVLAHLCRVQVKVVSQGLGRNVFGTDAATALRQRR
jgi:hypothetical protein